MRVSEDRVASEIWVHAVAAKAGGGITYLQNVVPEVVRQLEGQGVRVVLLLPDAWRGEPLPSWVEVRPMPRIAASAVLRVLFDQVVFPVLLRTRPKASAYCSGSYAPVMKTVSTVSLLRNAIYFSDEFLSRERVLRRLKLRMQAKLILWGARGSRAVHYPSRSMKQLVESRCPSLRSAGVVNPYGVGAMYRTAKLRPNAQARPRPMFLYVMNYTLQKNLGFVLEALAMAREECLAVNVVVTCVLESAPRSCGKADRRLIEDNRLIEEGYLEFVGPKFGQGLLDLYARADACLFPSICESFGHPLVEAIALGKPVIAADRPYAHEICRERAVYVDPNVPATLVDVWRRELWREVRVSQRDAETIRQRHSWERHVRRLLADLLTDPASEIAPQQEQPLARDTELTRAKGAVAEIAGGWTPGRGTRPVVSPDPRRTCRASGDAP